MGAKELLNRPPTEAELNAAEFLKDQLKEQIAAVKNFPEQGFGLAGMVVKRPGIMVEYAQIPGGKEVVITPEGLFITRSFHALEEIGGHFYQDSAPSLGDMRPAETYDYLKYSVSASQALEEIRLSQD